jgi:signal transduction histidine kinase
MPRRAPGRSTHPASSREAELEALLAERERELADVRRALVDRDRRHAATAEVLRVIASAPTALDRVLDAILERAADLSGAENALLYRPEGDHLLTVAARGRLFARPEPSRWEDSGGWAIPIDPGWAAARALVERRTIHIPDIEAASEQEYPVSKELARRYGWRTVLVAPLMREGTPIGVLSLTQATVRPFGQDQIAMVETFANQAVIAIENARLFSQLNDSNASLREALEQQTATAGVLQAISRSPTELPAVLDIIVASAGRLCAAENALLFRVEDGSVVPVAAHGPLYADPDMRRARRPLARDWTVGRAIVERRVVHVHDILEELETYPRERRPATVHGHRTLLVVPLAVVDGAIGAIGLSRSQVTPFAPEEIRLVETFANQAVIAMENARLFAELQARTAELTRSVARLTALFEVAQAVGGTLDLQRVLDAVVARAADLAGADGGAVYEYDPVARAFDLRATHRMEATMVAALREARVELGADSVLGRAGSARQPVQVEDLLAETPEGPALRGLLTTAGYRAVLAVPLLREHEVVGALVVRRRAPGAFDPDTVALLQTFATQSALAIQNARLFQKLADKSHQLEEASRHKSEFLASMSHELRTPLNAVIGFTEVLLERYFGEINAKQEEYLRDVLSSGQHLLSLINDILDLSKVEAGRMELELGTFDLGPVLAAGLVMVRERASRGGVALSLDAGEGVGEIEADERKVKQVLFNLLTNAVKFTPDGGAVGVSARRADGWVEVAVADTGVGIAPEEQDRVFEEFGQARSAAGQSEGTGLGLTLCKRFVELHGGTISVASEVGLGSTFTVSLPVRQPAPPLGPPGQP